MNSATPNLSTSQAYASCLFVGAMVDGRIAAQVRSMHMGERFEKIVEAG